ncbi:MAG: TonB-dependent receptor [Leptospira sp.]|nr:TonB-dependent receptor [Leptospira sp.]
MKTVTQLNDKHAITTKIGAHQQEANISYLGQTTPQFWNNPKSNFGEQDVREIERYQIVLGHEYTISPDARVKTKTYWNQTRRDWGRQNYSRNNTARDTEPRNSLREYDTNPFANRPGDTVWMRDDMSYRNRTYRSMGIESKLELNFETGSVKHELDLGARYHYDQAQIRFLQGVATPDFAIYGNGFDQRPTELVSSPYSLNKSGILRDDELREAKALAGFIQDRVRITEKFAVIPGVRYETFTQSRLIRRGRDFDPQTFQTIGSGSQQLDRSAQTTTNILIPGFGTTYDFTKSMTWFTGVHRGFAPARYESAISPVAEDIALKPETSWNYETGVRGKATRYLEFQLTGYVMEFDDQIINSSAAGGNLGSRPVNGGRSVHRGFEADMVLDFGKLARSKWEVPLEVIYSRNEAHSDQYTFNLDAWEKGITDPLVHIDTNGNRLPYVSRDVVTVAFGTKAPNGFYVMGEWQYFSKQYNDLQNTRTYYGQDLLPNNLNQLARFNGYGTGASETNGLNGVIPAYELVNLSIGIRKEKWSVFLVAKNLMDRKYISTRLPEGIQPGPFRQVNVGLSLYL